MWNPDAYLKRWLATVKPAESFRAKTLEEWEAWRERLRFRFIGLLGSFPANPPELAPVLLESIDCGSYTRQRIEFQTFAELRMPVYVLIPKRRTKEKLAAVIACHGHGYGSKDIVGLNQDGTSKTGDPGYQKNFAVELVNRGYLTVAPELLGFGDRRLAKDTEAANANSCHDLSAFLLAMGQTMAGHRVYETLRCVDYLLTREDTDPDRIGCMGISGGGLVCSFAAAVDERIRNVVISGFVNSFEASILSIHHCIDNYVPGLSLTAEMPDLLGLIAPRRLLVEAGREDPIFPVEGTISAYEQIRAVYSLLGSEDRLDLDLNNCGHEISGAKAYDWFGTEKTEGTTLP